MGECKVNVYSSIFGQQTVTATRGGGASSSVVVVAFLVSKSGDRQAMLHPHPTLVKRSIHLVSPAKALASSHGHTPPCTHQYSMIPVHTPHSVTEALLCKTSFEDNMLLHEHRRQGAADISSPNNPISVGRRRRTTSGTGVVLFFPPAFQKPVHGFHLASDGLVVVGIHTNVSSKAQMRQRLRLHLPAGSSKHTHTHTSGKKQRR